MLVMDAEPSLNATIVEEERADEMSMEMRHQRILACNPHVAGDIDMQLESQRRACHACAASF